MLPYTSPRSVPFCFVFGKNLPLLGVLLPVAQADSCARSGVMLVLSSNPQSQTSDEPDMA